MEATMAATLRTGTRADTDWLYRLFKETNRTLIEASWGWDELLQREAFFTNLPGNQFQILELRDKPVGGYHLLRKPDHLWLEMFLVKPDFQRQGLGTLMMNAIKDQARAWQLPVRLSVLHSNPARHFYAAQSFEKSDKGEFSVKMQWQE